MRPYFILTAVVLLAVAAFGQQPFPHPNGACFYGCGPYVPLLTTPMMSLQSVSPNPVGASNATTGLVAGATNSTLALMAQTDGTTSSEYTVPVWYQGGAPLVGSQVHGWPEPVGHEGHGMREMVREERREISVRDEHAPHAETRGGWIFFTGSEHVSDAAQASATAKGGKKAGHVYTNEDVERENEKNGTVKHDGKTEKL